MQPGLKGLASQPVIALATPKSHELIPRSIIFGDPIKAGPQISPDGKQIAYFAPFNGVLNVWVKTIGVDDDRPVTAEKNRRVHYFVWAYTSNLLLYSQDRDGDENWRLYGIDLATNEVREYTPYADVSVFLLSMNRDYPNQILIQMNKEDARFHDAYLLNLLTGELTLVAKNPGTIGGWVADEQLKVRGALAATEAGGFNLLVRADEQSPWNIAIQWDFENSLTSSPVQFSKDGQYLYIIDSREHNTGRLKKMNLRTGACELIAADDKYDVAHVMFHPITRELQAVFFERERWEWQVVDESIRADVELLSKLQRGDLHLISRDDADRIWLVMVSPDNGPVSYYWYDRTTKTATFLFDNRPELRRYLLAEVEPVTIKARDGMLLHCYLTLPVTGKKHLPLVLLVHGGPQHRDAWGLDPEVQWLANRGYAVLQVNFRGSTGYGKAYLNAGDKEIGGKMHDDLVDGVQWAIEQGIADPARVAIYGGSYGGYAALAGATFTPDVFCCAVDIFGPSNLVTLIRSIPPYWTTFAKNMKQRMGDPDTEEEFLKSRSPLFKVHQIKIPILIAQGANDPRVKQAESEQIVEAMKQNNLEFEYMLFPDEGHGFVVQENRLKFYAAAEQFLAKYLGGLHEE